MKEKFALFFRLGFYVSIVLLLISMPFYFSKIYRLGIYFLSISYPLEYVFSQRYKNWKWQKSMWFYLAAIALFLISPLWELFFTRDFSNEIFTENIGHLVPFLALGVIGLLGFPPIRIHWVALISLSVIICASVYILFNADLNGFFLTINMGANPFNLVRLQKVSSHTCFNLYANMALVFGYFTLRNKEKPFPLRLTVGIMMALVCFAVFVTEGRIGYSTMLFLVSLMIFSIVWRRSHRWALVMLVILTFSVNSLLSFHERNIENLGAREDIWRVAFETGKSSPIFGYGVIGARKAFVERGLTDERLQEKYIQPIKEYHPDWQEFSFIHPHNSFLEIWMETGIFGLGLFLSIFLLPLLMCDWQRAFVIFMLTFTFSMQATCEPLGKYFPPMIYMLFMLIFLQNSEKENEKLF